jgi:hypothetical protein
LAEIDIQRLIENLREQRSEAGESEAGILGMDDLVDAVSHPAAAAKIEEFFALESTSVQQGEPAPEIDLPWLGAPPAGRSERFSLAAHCGARPVALIFGSYT